MKTESIRALRIFAIILVVLGTVISSPSGKFFLFVVATLVALPSVIFGSSWARIGGAIVCIFSVALAMATFSAMQRDQATYLKRVQNKGSIEN